MKIPLSVTVREQYISRSELHTAVTFSIRMGWYLERYTERMLNNGAIVILWKPGPGNTIERLELTSQS